MHTHAARPGSIMLAGKLYLDIPKTENGITYTAIKANTAVTQHGDSTAYFNKQFSRKPVLATSMRLCRYYGVFTAFYDNFTAIDCVLTACLLRS